ncbi:hypothetical protein K432DRAFT_447702 [Lepidopterella palustris CBS 459.81]|uniref:Uncharacterized protein n=1 Tax=Lepidopterella palustris CBS 459.81 TaxID=1314670 RepID=A0A8E2DY64_9PEZI|nr:hypothetical protein K432DRAFT_447702 [Lepidopterella palustris CBS 459.81]
MSEHEPSSWVYLPIPTYEDLGFEPDQLRRLPPELRLQVFRFVFDADFCKNYRIAINDASFGECHFSEFEAIKRAIPYLHASVVGTDIAIEAAEEFYKSRITFYPGPPQLLDILSRCSLSTLNMPGRWITNLQLHFAEDQGFLGEGADRKGLRKADWVFLNDQDNEWMIRSPRTQLFRRGSRALLRMPRLKKVGIRIVPADKWKPASDPSTWEVRDIIPTVYRLRARGVTVTVKLRIMRQYFRDPGRRTRHIHPTNGKVYACSTVDISACFPFHYPHHNGLADRSSIIHSGDCVGGTWSSFAKYRELRQRNSEALQELFDRLMADKALDFVDGDFRRIIKNRSKKRKAKRVSELETGPSSKKLRRA